MTERFRRLRDRVGDLGVEVVAIVLSVLLAFAVDDCRQQRADRRLVDNVMITIRDELEHNRGEIEAALPHHRDLARQLRGDGLKLESFDLTTARVDLEDARSVEGFLRRELARRGASIPPGFSVNKTGQGVHDRLRRPALHRPRRGRLHPRLRRRRHPAPAGVAA